MRRALTALIVLIALGCSGGSNDHLDRARKLIGSGQWANARTELGQVLAKDAHSATARALLVYCLDREDGLRHAVDLRLQDLDQVSRALDHGDWQHVPADTRKAYDRMFTEARKKLFDKGIDTRDARDVIGVVAGAARYSFDHDDDAERKAAAATVLATDGDAAALGYLVTQLKGERTAPIVDHLVAIGPVALGPLRAAIADAGFIGRRAALDAAARIQAGIRGHALIASRPGLTAIAPSVPGQPRLSQARVAIGRDPELLALAALYVALDGAGADGLVLLEAWDGRSAGVLVQLFAARGGELVPVQAVDHGAPLELGGPAVVYGLEIDHGRAIARRLVETHSQREVDAGPGPVTPVAGMRVRLASYAARGTIIRPDDGLWLVKLDAPVQGLTELPVPASAVIELRRALHTEISVETLSGALDTDRWDITRRDLAPDATPETSESSK